VIAPPPAQRAALPAELRGLRRDGARLCVVDGASRRITHTDVAGLADHLQAGDVLVLNSSRTLPAAIRMRRDDGSAVQIRPTALRDGWHGIAVGTDPPHHTIPLQVGERLRAATGLVLRVSGHREDVPLLWSLIVEAGDAVDSLLQAGEPIRYSYVPDPVPLEHYQTVYAGVPGSVETPSAGRHLTWELLRKLRHRGVAVTDVLLHCGLSSLQDDDADARKPLVEEWFEVGERAAGAINAARRVVAVGTTVVRALETSAGADCRVREVRGWTELKIAPSTELRVVDALLTGLHEPPATHLDMLGAVIDKDLLDEAYAEVRERGYLWHEFGDAMLIAR
jgi:S-adenosylmethionine:tRNA ribosyltransferase-isomerase